MTNFILDQLAADPAIAPEFRAAIKPQFFQARCGRRRMFLSQNDAARYDEGYSAHPAQPERPIDQHSPAWDGYFDREEEVMEAFDDENEWGEDA